MELPLKELIDEKGFTVKFLAMKLGMNPGVLSILIKHEEKSRQLRLLLAQSTI